MCGQSPWVAHEASSAQASSFSSTPHCDQHTTECVWPPPAISVWSHNEGHGDCIASIIHTQRQARLKHVKQYRLYESRIKHLSVLRRRHDVYACVTAHRCACTQKVSHSFPPHGTAVNPLGGFFFFNLLTVLISQLRRGDNSVYLAQNTLVNEQDPCWVKHLVRRPNTNCDEMNVCLGQEVEGGSRQDFMKTEISSQKFQEREKFKEKIQDDRIWALEDGCCLGTVSLKAKLQTPSSQKSTLKIYITEAIIILHTHPDSLSGQNN